MAVTTAAAIRDRISAVITALTPTVLSGDTFRESRNEYEGDFKKWAKAHASASLRRFQVRDSGKDGPAKSSNTTEEYRFITWQVLVAYPTTHRYGAQAGLDLDDVKSADQHQIETAIGMRGGANFTGSNPNADWTLDPPSPFAVPDTDTDRDDDAVHFLVITQTMGYWRTM